MRRCCFLFLLLAGSVLAPGQEPALLKEDVEFVEARKLFWSGQYDEAERLFKIYLSANPDHGSSKSFLQLIGLYRRHVSAGEAESRRQIEETRQRLAGIRVEKLEFKDAEWRDVAARLQALANSKKDGQPPLPAVTFINTLPEGVSARVSIKLEDMDLLGALEACCRRAGLRFAIDLWAVIIDLPESGKK